MRLNHLQRRAYCLAVFSRVPHVFPTVAAFQLRRSGRVQLYQVNRRLADGI